MNKKSLRIILALLVLIFILISLYYASYFETTYWICKDKTEIDNASSTGFKSYSYNEINSGIERKSLQQINETNLLNDSIKKDYKAKVTTETTTSYACIIPFFSPISFNAKVNLSLSIYDKTETIKTYTDMFVIQGKLKFFGYKSIGNSRRLIQEGMTRQVDVEIRKIIKSKMEELK